MTAPIETGLIGGPEKRGIVIVDYDLAWPAQFALHARRIQGALSDAAIRIEHIGSTSVPGLAAKPVIDILVVVADSSAEEFYFPQLTAAGYALRVREPDWHEHRMFRTANKDVHIHVYSEGCQEIERNLLFRTRLRNNTDDRNQYQRLKQSLATRAWSDMNEYANAKGPLIEQIIQNAREEIGAGRG